MKRTATDIVILLLIATPVTALALLMPKDDLRIERNWGTVIYSPPVSFAEASAFADVMVDQGVFMGSPVAFKLQRNDDDWILMMASQRNYQDVVDRESMAALGYELCAQAFPGKTASFVLIDEDLEPFEELVAPTPFSE